MIERQAVVLALVTGAAVKLRALANLKNTVDVRGVEGFYTVAVITP
jgi:hypothetical protein